jgi:ubiquinone/menaquinone biosynthesis C-methylase UbiE
MTFRWPDSLPRVPDEDWTTNPLEELALKYDTVESHGWYENLEPTLDELVQDLRQGQTLIDYSGGTGILLDRLLRRVPNLQAGALLVDSSPKFLRLALEKLRHDPRVAFRLIRFLKEERRLQLLDEVMPPSLLGQFDVLCSTNAIHLYYDLPETLRSWWRAVAPGARVLVQSGNIANPTAPPDTWVIDATVDHIDAAARQLVRDRAEYASFRPGLDEPTRMVAYDRLRNKFFLPVRPLAHYVDELRRAGFEVARVVTRSIAARVADWNEFLSAYHEGVLGWAGGSPRVDGTSPSADVVALRLRLLAEALERVFDCRPSFQAAWTYITCTRG